MPETKIIATTTATNHPGAYKTILKSNQYTVIADEPVAVGGTEEGPAPGEYLCMALAACKTITMRMYVQRKNWDIGDICVSVALNKTNETPPVHTFLCEISVSGSLTDEQKERLVYIAKACPISKLLATPVNVITTII